MYFLIAATLWCALNLALAGTSRAMAHSLTPRRDDWWSATVVPLVVGLAELLNLFLLVCFLCRLRGYAYLIARRMTSIEASHLSRLWDKAFYLGVKERRHGADMRYVHVYDMGTSKNLQIFLFGPTMATEKLSTLPTVTRVVGAVATRALYLLLPIRPIENGETRPLTNPVRVRERMHLEEDIAAKINERLLSSGLRPVCVR